MEGDVGAQVAPPIFFHHQQPLTAQLHEAPPFAKKRDFPWQNQSFIQSQRLMGADIPNPGSGNWNPRMWEWDSLNFIAKPSADGAQLASGAGAGAAPVEGQKKRGDASSKSDRNREEDSENLTLKLGGENYTVEPSAAVRPTKRVRSGPLGNGGCYPMCQVDDCRADLSGAKDYHRRHKVCEVHSKTTKALVGNQMQRFCQQCSR